MEDNSNMKTHDSPFWVTITMESEEAEDTVRKAIAACVEVHDWSIGMLTTQWLINSSYRVKTADLMPELTPLMTVHNIKDLAQRFAFMTTVSRAIARFYQELFVGDIGLSRAEVVFPAHRPPKCYQVLDIQQRTVWKKYMAEHSRISTHYGSMFLEGDWRKVLFDQAKEMKVQANLIPYLMYSVTVREKEDGWEAHFNLHEPRSQHGKEGLKQWHTAIRQK